METPECWKTFEYGIYKEMADRNIRLINKKYLEKYI